MVSDTCKSRKKIFDAYDPPLLVDIIRNRGAPTKLVSDRVQVEISNKAKDILRYLHIADWQSEAHHQHQNPCQL